MELTSTERDRRACHSLEDIQTETTEAGLKGCCSLRLRTTLTCGYVRNCPCLPSSTFLTMDLAPTEIVQRSHEYGFTDGTVRRVQRLSQDNQIKQLQAWLLLGWSACLTIGGGSEVTFKHGAHYDRSGLGWAGPVAVGGAPPDRLTPAYLSPLPPARPSPVRPTPAFPVCLRALPDVPAHYDQPFLR
ncbi:hypothetical protein J6590_072382 [Homalodisca vitripennis]|nr:hypothetical protein J6590_072382 [Homalodisca vitripennis]